MPAAEAQLEALFRREAGNISAWLARLLGPARLALIEDAVQDAFGAALAQWPFEGTPQKPAAWLAIAARNKALDRIRREARLDSLDPSDEAAAWRLGFSNPEDAGKADDTLALMFVACHPALNAAEQAMLTLQTVCGFNPREIARAYLSTPEAVTQRLVRAKRRLRELKPAFEIPEGGELAGRLPALLNAIYLLFNGGYTAAEGEALMRRELCAESLRLVSLLCEHPATASGEMPRARSARVLSPRTRRGTYGRGRRPGAARGAGPHALGLRAHPAGFCAPEARDVFRDAHRAAPGSGDRLGARERRALCRYRLGGACALLRCVAGAQADRGRARQRSPGERLCARARGGAGAAG